VDWVFPVWMLYVGYAAQRITETFQLTEEERRQLLRRNEITLIVLCLLTSMRYLAYLALAAPLVVSLILHVPSLPPFLGNWGFKYSDIVSVANSLERPERWFDHGKYLDFTAHRGCYLPYVDYHFEYPPLVGLLWAFSTCLSGWDLDLHLYIHAGAIAAGYAGLLWALSKLVPKRRLWLLLASPSLYLYAVYNWDVLAASLALVGVVYVRSRPLLAGLIHGLAFNVKWIAAGVAYYYGVALWGQKVWRRYAAGAVLGAVAPMATLYLFAPGGFWHMINHHARWYCENCLYLFAVGELYSPLHRFMFVAVAGFIAALFPVLGRRIEERHALLGAAISLTVFNYVFSPQMFLFILPFGLMALSKIGLALLWFADLANFGIMATWYYAEHPHVTGPPQTFAFYRNLLLLIIFAGIAAGAELRRLSFIYAATKRLPWTYVGLVSVAVAYLLSAYSVASLPGADGMPGGQGYISDEVWYVTSARNILHDFFGVSANSPYYTTTKSCLTERSRVVKEYVNIDAVAVEGDVSCYIRRGFPYPDKEGILSYYNLEHPPLAKYVIAAVEAVRDEPIFWRLPSMALGAATLLLVFLAAKKLAGELWALAAAALMLFDNTFRAMSGVAMLDIYLGFFTALLAYLHLSGQLLGTGAALGLATSVKYSGAFPVFGLVYIYARRSFRELAAVLLMAMSIFLLVNMPIAGRLGIERWIHEIISALSWHTTSRPPGPTASTPLDWLFMQNSFTLHVNPNVYASGTPAYLAALIYALYKRDDTSILFLSTYGGYWLVYLAGNHTLYSYYTAHFSPLAHIVLAQALAALWSLAKRVV
jgi:predicted membrane-bound dolichyl-phosphate-mannose-protein mannosyltransferase